MKRILVTGAGGYIGRSIVKSLGEQYEVVGITRLDVDLLKGTDVDHFFASNKPFDFVIHCAVVGGSRLKYDNADVLHDNLTMFSNLMKWHNTKFATIINIGSGAEFDIRYDIKPTEHSGTIPVDPYGMSKFFIASHLRQTPNTYNLRVYGLFDENELETRFIKTVIKNSIRRNASSIVSPLHMSFMYMPDFITMLRDVIDGNIPNTVREFDCVYPVSSHGMPTLTDIAEYIQILAFGPFKVYNMILDNTGPTYYTGTPNTWFDYGKLVGFEGGIDTTYLAIKSKMTWHE